MTKQANQPAFAAVAMCLDGSFQQEGLTKREYFAAMALQGILADPNITGAEPAAVLAVSCADHLLAELEKEQTV